MGISFTPEAAGWILEQCDYAEQQPRNPTQPNPSGQQFTEQNIQLYEITTVPVISGNEYKGAGNLVCWDNDNTKYTAVTTAPNPQDLWYPQAPRGSGGNADATKPPPFAVGQRVWAAYRGRWEIVGSSDSLRPFELTAPDFICGPYGGTTPTTLSAIFLDDPAAYGSETAQTLYWLDSSGSTAVGIGRARKITGSPQYCGTRGWARLNTTTGHWEIIWGDFKQIAEGKVDTYGDIIPGNSGQVDLWWCNMASTPDMEYSNYKLNACNISGRRLAKGEAVQLYWDRQEGKWYVSNLKEIWLTFELKYDLTPGSYAYAFPMKCDGSDADTSSDRNADWPLSLNSGMFQVYDAPEGCRKGLGRDTTGTSNGAHGARGKCRHNFGTARYEIVSMQCLAKLIKVNYAGSAISAGGTFSPSYLTVLDDGQSPVKAAGLGSVSIVNYSVGLPANAQNIMCVSDGGWGYLVIDGPCPV